MLIILISIALILVLISIYLYRRANHFWDEGPLMFISVMLAFIMSLVFIGMRTTSSASVREFKSIEQTISDSRLEPNSIERVAFLQKIADENAWLANEQHWATNPWTPWFCDPEVLTLKPIK